MRILMFGWEFPPRISGGLGTACFGMTRALADIGCQITFVLPHACEATAAPFLSLLSATGNPLFDSDPTTNSTDNDNGLKEQLSLQLIPSLLNPYLNQGDYHKQYLSIRKWLPGNAGIYGPNLIAEVFRYGRAAGAIAQQLPFDIIHAHDWMTFPAALNARQTSNLPLILHIHSLEYDRSGENVNREICAIEREGLERADHIIAVSYRTRRMIVERYGIKPEKITVVHNAVSRTEAKQIDRVERNRKMVLFLGRITFQKGPDYFVEAAARVLQVFPDVTFVMAGDGNMMTQMIERVAELGIGDHFHFTGFLQGEEIERIYSLSDLYIMPSVSEPFGISPLEAILYDVPVIISRQSGIAEILKHALKVDFWDVREIAAKIVAVLKYPALAGEMVRRRSFWRSAGKQQQN
jgi:glycogen(starch) synthase